MPGEVAGFNIHAGVTIRAGDRAGLERLCRYGARPPFSLERISLLPDGRVAYRLRKPRRNGATHLVLAPVHFLARIAALVPPPRYPLLRLSGVLASGSSWRAAAVAHGPAATSIPVPVPETKTSATAPPTCKSDITAPPPAATWDPPASTRTSLGDGIVLPSTHASTGLLSSAASIWTMCSRVRAVGAGGSSPTSVNVRSAKPSWRS
jgi:hypothetical protein